MGDSSKLLLGLRSRSIEVRLTSLQKLTEIVSFYLDRRHSGHFARFDRRTEKTNQFE